MTTPHTFIDAYIAGQAEPPDIDDWVEQWHSQPGNQPLHEYLGLSPVEYEQWLKAPDSIETIIQAKRP